MGKVRAAKALVIAGDGINCEQESAWGLELAGFDVTTKHVSELLKQPGLLKESKLLCIPGGFSFGDEIASGKVLAVKIRHYMQEQLQEFVDAGNLLLAICNGFQVVVQMGLLPNSDSNAAKLVSLTRNRSGKFINRWVTMDVVQNPATKIYFDGLSKIELPMRHGEGNIKLQVGEVGEVGEVGQLDGGGGTQHDLQEVVKERAALRYCDDVNGSFDRIASLTNKSGTVMGLMPHPEAFVRWTQHPEWTSRKRNLTTAARGEKEAIPDGLRILQNAHNYVQNAL